MGKPFQSFRNEDQRIDHGTSVDCCLSMFWLDGCAIFFFWLWSIGIVESLKVESTKSKWLLRTIGGLETGTASSRHFLCVWRVNRVEKVMSTLLCRLVNSYVHAILSVLEQTSRRLSPVPQERQSSTVTSPKSRRALLPPIDSAFVNGRRRPVYGLTRV